MPQTNTSIVDISLVKAVASYIIPLISVALSYVFGRLESKTSSTQVLHGIILLANSRLKRDALS